MRLGLRRSVHWAQYARALHHMPQGFRRPLRDVERRQGTLKVKRGRPAGPRMPCGWGCGGWLTSHVMRAHFTRCPNRPAALPQVNSLDRRGKNSKAKRGRPPGRRMPCGWRCGTRCSVTGGCSRQESSVGTSPRCDFLGAWTSVSMEGVLDGEVTWQILKATFR
jgi:hypothetical protein